MKVVAFNGIPRKGCKIELPLSSVCAELNKEGIETEVIQVWGKPVHSCTA
jgi:multimeric flavodoxin WrbA